MVLIRATSHLSLVPIPIFSGELLSTELCLVKLFLDDNNLVIKDIISRGKTEKIDAFPVQL